MGKLRVAAKKDGSGGSQGRSDLLFLRLLPFTFLLFRRRRRRGHAGVRRVRRRRRRHGRLVRAIESTFGEESLTAGKFVAVADAARSTLLRNCALLSNRIQAFDVDGYRATRRRLPSLGEGSLASEQLAMYEDALADMREVIEANERLLLEMGKLEMEVSDLEGDDNREDNTRMLDEVRDLLEQTKYYR